MPAPAIWESCLAELPAAVQARAGRYYHWQDRVRYVLGILLLRTGLEDLGFPVDLLKQVQYSSYDRPGLPADLDFNLAHAGDYVLCALSAHTRVGVDVEPIREVNFGHFERMMTAEQWRAIHASSTPYTAFFRRWVAKESVIKADGQVLLVPLDELEIDGQRIVVDARAWYLHALELDGDHAACLACAAAGAELTVKKKMFWENDQ